MGDGSNIEITPGSIDTPPGHDEKQRLEARKAGQTGNSLVEISQEEVSPMPLVPESGSGRKEPPDYLPITITKEVPPPGKPGPFEKMIADNTTTVLNENTVVSQAKPMAKNTK